MDLPPTFRINGELFFRVRPKLGPAGLHAALAAFYADVGRIDRLLIDHKTASFEADALVAALREAVMPDGVRVIAMGPGDIADVTFEAEEGA